MLTANINTLSAGVMAETLRYCGVTHAVIAPGSRSAPLTLAFALNARIETTAVLDERSAAFFALGIAKRTRNPVALVCTSGTAAANFLPAVIEAHYSQVPLIVLTADRPAHLRGVGAGQAIDQQKLYGAYAAYAHELPLPRFDLLPYMRQTMIQAHLRAVVGGGGVVHLNVPFEEPLAPVAAAEPLPPFDAGDFFAACQRASLPDLGNCEPASLPWDLEDALAFGAKGLIIAGPYALGQGGGLLEPLLKIGQAAGWPVLADVLSRLRHHEVPGLVRVAHYDAILRNEKLARELLPDFVLQIGPLPTSKVLRNWLATHRPRRFVVSTATTELHDPLHGPVTPIVGSLAHLAAGFALSGHNAYSRRWQQAQAAIEEKLQTRLAALSAQGAAADASTIAADAKGAAADASAIAADAKGAVAGAGAQDVAGAPTADTAVSATDVSAVAADSGSFAQVKRGRASALPFEGCWPAVLAQALPAQTLVFVASSMPVRDAEAYWPLNDKGFQWYFSRGANGIDGTLSTALGVAHTADHPAVLVTGDLSFLHDQNGLLIAPWFKGSLSVLLINNDGGGIFDHLPIADFDPPFEAYFATPQNVDFAKLAAAHGIRHHLAKDWSAVAKLFAKLPQKGIRIVEIRTDRKADAVTRKAFWK